MPFSNTDQISPIMAEIVHLNPHSILDVGCGLGVYGMLCRIHLDLYHDPIFYKKLDGSQPWHTRIEGIEGCEMYMPYIPCWAYDHIHTGNALDIIPTMSDGRYDLILILAMIEHLTHEQGIQLLDHLKRISRAIILSVPKNWQEQEILGYPLETHRSHWTEQELRNAGFTRFLPHWGAWLAVYGIPPRQESSDEGIIDYATERADSLGSLAEQLNRACTDISSLNGQIAILNQITEQIRHDTSRSLINQQVIFDRLSISSRLRSLKNRLRKFLAR
jgi:hypothetical protein